MGRSAAGVRGMKLKADDEVVSCDVAYDDCTLLVVTDAGYGKRTQLDKFNAQGRGGQGVRAMKLTEKKGAVIPKDTLVGVTLKSTTGGADKHLKVDGLFVAIGHEPNVKLFKDFLAVDDKGYLVTMGKSTRAQGKDGKWVEGLFACGDVQDSYYRQAVTAAGTGCMAAIDAERWLAKSE